MSTFAKIILYKYWVDNETNEKFYRKYYFDIFNKLITNKDEAIKETINKVLVQDDLERYRLKQMMCYLIASKVIIPRDEFSNDELCMWF